MSDSNAPSAKTFKAPTTLTLEGNWGSKEITAELSFSQSLTYEESLLVKAAWEKGFEAGVACVVSSTDSEHGE